MPEVLDRGEEPGLMEPLRIGEVSGHRASLTELAFDLAQRSAQLRSSLPADLVAPLADLVRSMNCYYSNLIEGHDTHPIDIERALANDYSADAKKRDLQLEAKAHIEVQRWIDAGGIEGQAHKLDAIREIHRRFCELLPDEMLWVEDPVSKKRLRVVPGELRQCSVEVGRHVPVSPGAVPRFLRRFEDSYEGLGKAETLLALAAMHHRLLWIHPFLDGNGRVARLMSNAVLQDTLDTGALWSVSRGLARSEAAYKGHLAACDLLRRNDLDGRGHLSEESLAAFTRFFLECCLDQAAFMHSLVEPHRLRARILLWAEEEIRLGLLPSNSGAIFEALLYRGEIPRADLSSLLGIGERQARRILAALLDRGVVASEGGRTPLRLVFPASLAARWMPGLFPESPSTSPASPETGSPP
jgi:Fic family protein